MRLHGPSPPQGKNAGRSLLFSLLPPHVQYSPPQQFGGGISPLAMEFEGGDWFDVDFEQRIPLTINGGQVPSTQFNFPLLVNDTYPDMIGAVLTEIRFAGIDGVQLEYEIQRFDTENGELIAWIKKPTVSDDDFLGVYFDNPGASDEQNPAAVWDANYKYVGHLQNNANDSTGNVQDLTNFGSALTPVSAKIGNGQFYNDTTSDFSRRNPFTGWPTTEITAEFWFETTDTSNGFISYAVSSDPFNFIVDLAANIRTVINNLGVFSGTAGNDGIFHHFVSTWRSSDGRLIMYLDGIVIGTGSLRQGVSFISNGSFVLGPTQTDVGGPFVRPYDGILDEVRISNTFRSADYITTSFNNQNSQSTFYSTGAVESAPSVNGGVMDFETLSTMEFES